MRKQVLFFLVFFQSVLLFSSQSDDQALYNLEEKVLICGVCRNVEKAVLNDIENFEKLGARFKDYVVIICEDNSTDNTVSLFSEWAEKNPKVIFQSEKYSDRSLVREEKIARARNKVLDIAGQECFDDFSYLIMVDLDFITPWPIDEIVKTTLTKGDWDCVSSNGLFHVDRYYDLYAFRDFRFPLGPELIGDLFWEMLGIEKIAYPTDQTEWQAVFSGFGGLAIYKRDSIIGFSYSGKVTNDLEKYYAVIIASLERNNLYLQKYCKILARKKLMKKPIPVYFDHPICCEHVTLHASMALNGFGHFYVNPAMVMKYIFDGDQ